MKQREEKTGRSQHENQNERTMLNRLKFHGKKEKKLTENIEEQR